MPTDPLRQDCTTAPATGATGIQDAPTGRPKRTRKKRSFEDAFPEEEGSEGADASEDAVKATHTPLWAPRWEDKMAERQRALDAGVGHGIWGPGGTFGRQHGAEAVAEVEPRHGLESTVQQAAPTLPQHQQQQQQPETEAGGGHEPGTYAQTRAQEILGPNKYWLLMQGVVPKAPNAAKSQVGALEPGSRKRLTEPCDKVNS